MPGSAKCSFPLKFSYQNYVYIYHIPVHATCLSYLITGSLSPSSSESVGETGATVNTLGKGGGGQSAVGWGKVRLAAASSETYQKA